MKQIRSIALIAIFSCLAAVPAKAQTAPSQFSVGSTQLSKNCVVESGLTTYCSAYDAFCVSWAGAPFQCVSSFATAVQLAVNGVPVTNINLASSAQITFVASGTGQVQVTATIPVGAITFADLSSPPSQISGAGVSLTGLTFK